MRRKKHLKACHYRRLTIPIEIVSLEDNSYYPVIRVKIEHIAGDMIIDTGASVTVIDEQLFPELPGEPTFLEMQSGSVTGQIQHVRLVKAKEMQIGDRKFKNLKLAAIDLKYVNDMYNRHLNRKIIGLLGCDFCVKHKVVIDYRSKELSFSL